MMPLAMSKRLKSVSVHANCLSARPYALVWHSLLYFVYVIVYFNLKNIFLSYFFGTLELLKIIISLFLIESLSHTTHTHTKNTKRVASLVSHANNQPRH